jgi:putative transposase
MRPARETNRSNEFAYFVSTQTAGRKPFFRHERWARLMLATINHYAGSGYKLHAFVIMPDHLHLLITPTESVEKSVQLIKGGFSFRTKRELEWKGEIWQPGFTDHRIRDEEDWLKHLAYIRNNPVSAHLVNDAIFYEFMGLPNIEFPQGLKPAEFCAADVRAEARTLQAEARTLQPESSLTSIGAAKVVPFQNNGTSISQEVEQKNATQK